CRRACWLNFEAHPAQDESEVSLRICSRDMSFTSFRSFCHSERSRGIPVNCPSVPLLVSTSLPAHNNSWKSNGGEDRNRTYLVPPSGTTAVLKTARTTRHPSLSRLQKTPSAEFFARSARFRLRRSAAGRSSRGELDAAFERRTPNDELQKWKRASGYFAFLIALTIS